MHRRASRWSAEQQDKDCCGGQGERDAKQRPCGASTPFGNCDLVRNWPVVQRLRHGRDRLTADRTAGNVLERGGPRCRLQAALSQCRYGIGIQAVRRRHGVLPRKKAAA